LDLQGFRGHFPVVNTCTYADAAAIGPLPREAAVAAAALTTALCVRGSLVFPEMFEPVERARVRAATLLGCDATDIGFTDCTSQSMNLLARMAARDAPDSRAFVTLRDEFPSTTVPWLHHGFTPQWVDPVGDGHYPVDTILDAITPDTQAVVLSQVQYRTGARTDVAALAEALADRHPWLIVNATQAAGVVPQDVSGHTATTVTGLKWLCSGFGTGILHLSPALREAVPLPDQGWLSQRDFMAMQNDRLDPVADARAVELGGVGMSRLHALDASLGLILAATPAALQARTLALTGRLREGLEERSAVLLTPRQDHRRAGILSALRPDSEAWHLWALSAGVVQSQRGPGTIRFALHGYNNEDDVDALLEAWDHRP
jgi:cysteine desulfurase / selenocysteine lyase